MKKVKHWISTQEKKHSMTSKQETLKKITHIAYADGACKDNHIDASKVNRRAGSAIVVFPNSTEILLAIQSAFNDYNNSKNIDKWRTAIMTRDGDFIGTLSRAIPLPQPVAEPNKVSNNRAELHALNCVLAHFTSLNEPVHGVIYVDSQYVIKVFENSEKWKKNNWTLSSGTKACNIDYVLEMLDYVALLKSRGNTVTINHVPAHTKEKDIPKDFAGWCHWFGNDFVDRLSNVAAGVEQDINYKVSKQVGQKRKKIV